MKTFYKLDDKELEDVVIEFDFICDRSKRSGYIKGGVSYIEPAGMPFRRLDIYWARLSLGNVYLGSACIDPSLNSSDFTVCYNYCKVDQDSWRVLKERIRKEFINSSKYKNQLLIMDKLRDVIAEDKAMGFTSPMPEAEFNEMYEKFCK